MTAKTYRAAMSAAAGQDVEVRPSRQTDAVPLLLETDRPVTRRLRGNQKPPAHLALQELHRSRGEPPAPPGLKP